MKKLLLALPFVAGASWAGASYFAGAQTEDAYARLLTQLSGLTQLTLVNERYYAGIANSRAVTKVMDSGGTDARVLFRLQHSINHSPFGIHDAGVRVGAASITTKLVHDSALSEPVSEFISGFADGEPFLLTTEIGFDGAMINQLSINAYEYKSGDRLVRFQGGNVSTTDSEGTIAGAGELGDIVIADRDVQVKLTSGTVSTDLQRISQTVYTGSSSVGFGKLLVSSNQIPFDIVLQSIALTSDTRLVNGRMNAGAQFKIANIDAPVPLNSISADIAVKGISLYGIKHFARVASRIGSSQSMIGSGPETVEPLIDAYKSFSGPGTELEYNIKARNDAGQASFNTRITVMGGNATGNTANGFKTASTVRELLKSLKIETHFKAGVEFIEQSPLAMFMLQPRAKQFIVSDGVSYTSDVSVQDLYLDINGKTQSLEFNWGRILDLPLDVALHR